MLHTFKQFEGFSVTIHTNTNCILKCSYCYENHKAVSLEDDQAFWKTAKYNHEPRSYGFLNAKSVSHADHVISIDVAKKFIDQILEFDKTEFFEKHVTTKDAIILDFIGGDSLQCPDLLDGILTCFAQRLIKKNHGWLYSWRTSVSSNGVTLLNPAARRFCEKWKDSLSLGISIDGCPDLHDLNRWCFADNADGSHRGSFRYIKEIWPWYRKTFPQESSSTKWTIAPNSYEFLFQSVKYLHEELGIKYLMFNRVMEDFVQDTPEQLWKLIQQFQNVVDYTIEHHTELYVAPLDYHRHAVGNKTQTDLLRDDPTWSRCGFGKMPTVSIDGNVYPCFRMLPGHNNLPNSTKYAQGNVNTSLVENEAILMTLNNNSTGAALRVKDKCKTCKVFSSCPHCAADCVDENDATLLKTTSVCNFHRLEVYFARVYWERIALLHLTLYADCSITWTIEDRKELLRLVLEDIVNLTVGRNQNDL
jgi:uncharacterized protein